MDALNIGETLVFEGWRFDQRTRRLLCLTAAGVWTPVSIGSRALDILAVLLEQPGKLVSKDAILDAVWPNTAVEINNLAVQISTLRRVLDDGRTERSCIQTVTGRGYRFVVPVHPDQEALGLTQPPAADGEVPVAETCGNPIVTAPDAGTTADPDLATDHGERPRGIARLVALASMLCLVVGASAVFGLKRGFWLDGSAGPPSLSLVVLPFNNLSGDPKDEYLVDGITDDLTSDLTHVAGTHVISRESAYTYQGKPRDVRKIADELDVRYVIDGSVSRIGSALRINVWLASGATGADLWSDRFDEQITDLVSGQEQIVARMRSELGISLVAIENARSLHEHRTNPDAFDLILQARTLGHQPPSPQQYHDEQALFERALSLEPTSAPAMLGISFGLLLKAQANGGWDTSNNMRRVEQLIEQARAIAPDSAYLSNLTIQWLRTQGHYQEGITIAKELIRQFPNEEYGYYDLAQNLIVAGHADEAIPLEEQAIRIDPLSSWMYARYRDIGYASLLLGRDKDAITFLERSLALNPDNGLARAKNYRRLAAAYARTGQMGEARHALADADRLFPYDTVRSHWPSEQGGTVSSDPPSPVTSEQVRRFQDSLRLAGERDHADEDADFGIPPDAVLHDTFVGLTPTSATGARTIRTEDLPTFLARTQPIILDTGSYSWGRSIPGAIGLLNAGIGGGLTDSAQDRLRRKMQELTKGDLATPIVAVGWNSERFDGRNLALRLVALGYTQVYWYRGGRESWEAASLPETDLQLQQW
jgi:TolB-like protein/DNA-binding winged helix-turn-helix (wHTH) protein